MIPTSTKWQVGQRIKRAKPETLGTVVDVDSQVKVKWDTGATSYYSLYQARNLLPVETETNE